MTERRELNWTYTPPERDVDLGVWAARVDGYERALRELGYTYRGNGVWSSPRPPEPPHWLKRWIRDHWAALAVVGLYGLLLVSSAIAWLITR